MAIKTSRLFHKTVIIAAILTVVLLGLLFSGTSAKLKIYFFDVGHGDAIYIKTPEGYDILIDGGPNNRIVSKLGEAMPFYDRAIDILILTHPHADHVTGLIDVLNTYSVHTVYLTGAIHTTNEYLHFLELLNERDDIEKVRVDHQFTLKFSEDTKLEFLYPDFNVAKYSAVTEHPFIKNKLNNTSIVTKLIHKNKSFLFTGDIEKEVEAYLVRKGINLHADYLKVAHQGSKTSSSEAFLSAVGPEIGIIFVEANNSYGHPHAQVIERLLQDGITILRTDINGDIIL